MKTLTILILLHMTICLHAATRTIEAPDYMPLYERGIVIEKVKFEEDCTTVFFGTRGKGTAQLLQSICLTDEQGNRYKALRSKGIELGKGSKDTARRFSISFEPLPQGTRVFDCIENPSAQRFARFYAIRAKGQALDVFNKGTRTDNPFETSWFRIDTVEVSGRISDIKDELLEKGAKRAIYNGAERLLTSPLPGKEGGSYPPITVAADGTFHFKTVVSHPTTDELFLFGSYIPILLIPGDHLHVEVSHPHEYNQQVTFRSIYGNYSQLLTNSPFMHDEELDNPRAYGVFDTPTAQIWQALREKQEARLAISTYLAAKHQLTPTETKMMQQEILTQCALLSVIRMQNSAFLKYKEDLNAAKEQKKEFSWPTFYTPAQLSESGIRTDYTFMEACPMDAGYITAAPQFDALLSHMVDLAFHVQFGQTASGKDTAPMESNLQAMARQLGMSEDIGLLLVTEYHAKQMRWTINGQPNKESLRRLKELHPRITLPHAKAIAEAYATYYSAKYPQ